MEGKVDEREEGRGLGLEFVARIARERVEERRDEEQVVVVLPVASPRLASPLSLCLLPLVCLRIAVSPLMFFSPCFV